MTRVVAPYGSWRSPVSAQEVFAQAVGIGNLQYEGGSLYWSELRPDGKAVVVRRTAQGEIGDVTSTVGRPELVRLLPYTQ